MMDRKEKKPRMSMAAKMHKKRRGLLGGGVGGHRVHPKVVIGEAGLKRGDAGISIGRTGVKRGESHLGT